jgi:uncharacterized protein
MQNTVMNLTRRCVLHEHPRIAASFMEQAKGLMFTRPTNDCLIFPFLPARRVSMHMWFVFGPIDILALDGQGKVVALRKDFRPWTLWVPGVFASAVVELPAGTIARTGTAIGDRVSVPVTILK